MHMVRQGTLLPRVWHVHYWRHVFVRLLLLCCSWAFIVLYSISFFINPGLSMVMQHRLSGLLCIFYIQPGTSFFAFSVFVCKPYFILIGWSNGSWIIQNAEHLLTIPWLYWIEQDGFPPLEKRHVPAIEWHYAEAGGLITNAQLTQARRAWA